MIVIFKHCDIYIQAYSRNHDIVIMLPYHGGNICERGSNPIPERF